jgi:hypothetical protein
LSEPCTVFSIPELQSRLTPEDIAEIRSNYRLLRPAHRNRFVIQRFFHGEVLVSVNLSESERRWEDHGPVYTLTSDQSAMRPVPNCGGLFLKPWDTKKGLFVYEPTAAELNSWKNDPKWTRSDGQGGRVFKSPEYWDIHLQGRCFVPGLRTKAHKPSLEAQLEQGMKDFRGVFGATQLSGRNIIRIEKILQMKIRELERQEPSTDRDKKIDIETALVRTLRGDWLLNPAGSITLPYVLDNNDIDDLPPSEIGGVEFRMSKKDHSDDDKGTGIHIYDAGPPLDHSDLNAWVSDLKQSVYVYGTRAEVEAAVNKWDAIRFDAEQQGISIAEYEREHGLKPDSAGREIRRRNTTVAAKVERICIDGTCLQNRCAKGGDVHAPLTHYINGHPDKADEIFRVGGYYAFYSLNGYRSHPLEVGDDEAAGVAFSELYRKTLKDNLRRATQLDETAARIRSAFEVAEIHYFKPYPQHVRGVAGTISGYMWTPGLPAE